MAFSRASSKRVAVPTTSQPMSSSVSRISIAMRDSSSTTRTRRPLRSGSATAISALRVGDFLDWGFDRTLQSFKRKAQPDEPGDVLRQPLLHKSRAEATPVRWNHRRPAALLPFEAESPFRLGRDFPADFHPSLIVGQRTVLDRIALHYAHPICTIPEGNHPHIQLGTFVP